MNITSTPATITHVVFTAETVSSSVAPPAPKATDGASNRIPNGAQAARPIRLMAVEPPSPRVRSQGTNGGPAGLYPAVEDSPAGLRRASEGLREQDDGAEHARDRRHGRRPPRREVAMVAALVHHGVALPARDQPAVDRHGDGAGHHERERQAAPEEHVPQAGVHG